MKEAKYMEIGATIKKLRTDRHIKQEQFAEALGVSVQTVSRWENDVNYPDIAILPQIASFFHVTTDYLLGVKGEPTMAKLMRTTEEFQVGTREEAEKMVKDFQAAPFPKVTSYEITEEGKQIALVVHKEFGVELDQMKFD
jgi:transcriptional regulator with XRE-family HTH domain